MKYITIILLVVLSAYACLFAQEETPVLACLGENIDAPWYEPLSELTGESVWLGYPEGFDVPDDGRIIFILRGDAPYGRVMVWIVYAPSTPNYSYLFVYRDTTTTLHESGTYYVIHPCGAFRIGHADRDTGQSKRV
jgi:hypothetical protein